MELFEIMKNEKEIKSNDKILKICLNNGNVWNLERIEGQLNLIISEDKCINDIFEIALLSLKQDDLKDFSQFWSIKLSEQDKKNARPISVIYHMTGGDKMWKQGSKMIWNKEWVELSTFFSEWFDDKVMNLLKRCNTLGDLRNKLVNGLINSETFYEFGLKNNIIH